MKKRTGCNLKKSLLFIVLIAFVSCKKSASSGGVTGVGGGGDLCELEYKGLIPAGYDWLNKELKESVPATAGSYLSEMKRAKVHCVDEDLVVNGVPKTAISDLKTHQIKVNLKRWQSANRVAKKALVVHEGLVLIDVEQTDDYHISANVWKPSAATFDGYFASLHEEITAGIYDTKIEIARSGEFDGKRPKYKATVTFTYKENKNANEEVEEITIADNLYCFSSEVDPAIWNCSGGATPQTATYINTALRISSESASRTQVQMSIKSETFDKSLRSLPKQGGFAPSSVAGFMGEKNYRTVNLLNLKYQ
jgi:hypothetical protein